ncbi:hypothetical protein BD779DRAFT_1486128 [Infundibulicybe gibba]|nr:hypothetical protein BD779DRAFT_1486128 [Infundibulicybe gibba]
MVLILDLPVEILVRILDLVDPRSLLRCRETCSRILLLIDTTEILQFAIELFASGQEYGPSFSNPMLNSSRLDILKQHQAAWGDFKWTHEETIPMPSGSRWELVGGVLAHELPNNAITFWKLPSHFRSIQAEKWDVTGLDFVFCEFGMDPSQDLLILIELPLWSGPVINNTYRIHLRSLTANRPHQLAAPPAVLSCIQEVEDRNTTYVIQVSGDHLAVHFNTRHPDAEGRLVVWNWKSGQVEMIISDDAIRAFVFLTERHILVSLLYYGVGPSLAILDFMQESKESHTMDEAVQICTFMYPTLGPDVHPVAADIRSDPSPAWRPCSDDVPFRTAGTNRLFSVFLWIRARHYVHCVLLCVPLSTFTSCLGLQETEGKDIFDWEAWGPRGTRMMINPDHYPDVCPCCVHGTRYAAIETFGNNDLRIAVDILDFNQLAIRRELRNARDTPSRLLRNPNFHLGLDRMAYVTSETVIRNNIFRDEVRTSLPYRVRAFTLDSTYIPQCAVMCSEDGVVVVDMGTREYHIISI